jgi:predicted Zn-dependent protease with MMP-like domain
VTEAERERFDALLEAVLARMPSSLHELLERAPLLVEDHPSPQLMAELGLDPDDASLCGLHSGCSLLEQSVEALCEIPEHMHLFREGIIEHAGGWEPRTDDDGTALGGQQRIEQEIQITLLHEIGHHFGLDEDDLDRLGYA